MSRYLISALAFVLLSCSGERVLSGREKEALGLSGVIYDAKICPTRFDPATGRQSVSGECEYVTCTRRGDGVDCRARKRAMPVQGD